MAKLYTFYSHGLMVGWTPCNLGEGRGEIPVTSKELPPGVLRAAKALYRGDRVILSPEGEPSTAHVVAVDTYSEYAPNCPGSLLYENGGFTLIAMGWSTHNDAGFIRPCPHALLAIKDGQEGIFRATFSGAPRAGYGGGRRWTVALVREETTVLIPLNFSPGALIHQQPDFALRAEENPRVAAMLRNLLPPGENLDSLLLRLGE